MIKKFYIADLMKEYKLGTHVFNLKTRLQKYFEIKKDCMQHNKIYIEAEENDVKEIMLSIQKSIVLSKITDPIEKYEFLKKTISDEKVEKYKFTIKTYSEYIICFLNKSHDSKKSHRASSGFATLNYIITNISKDICYVDDVEILKLLAKETGINQKRFLSGYLEFLQKNYQDVVAFTLKNKLIVNRTVKNIDDFYTDKEWFFFQQYLCDIDKHIIKAFENRAYAKYWLYFLLHLSLAWRKNDILTIPQLDNLDIKKYTLEWFYNNEFTMDDALYIISNTKLIVELYYTHKTGTKLHFNVPMSLMIPTAIAIIISEQWARKKNEKTIFGSSRIQKEVIHKYFDSYMDEFRSLKANRTLLSLVNRTANQMDISHSVSAASYMRSHKMSYFGASSTTNTYLRSTYDDSELNYITKNLFEKGAFGWLFDYVISAYEDKEDFSFKSYDIESLENVSGYLLSEQCNKNLVVKELMQYSKEELAEILQGEVTSKQEYVYCIKKNCNRKIENKCIECQYSIPTVFAMHSVADEIELLLNKIKEIDSEYVRDRDRYLYRLLKLLRVAKSFGEIYGMNNLQLYLNFDGVMQQVQCLIEGSDSGACT